MKPADFLSTIVDPSLAKLAEWTLIRVTDEARVLPMAIAGQESGWEYRQQVGGPAHGFWQFEKGGGVAGVLRHSASAHHAIVVCQKLNVPPDVESVYQALLTNDTLACCMARLLLLTDPAPLPALGEQDKAWSYYERNWRPGAPHPEAWPERYQVSLKLVRP